MTIVLAKLGSPEQVGQFALGLAATAPIFMFATLRLRDIQATDARQEYLFGHYFALRLITTVLSLLVIAGIALASGYEAETALVILATGASKASEAISDGFYGLFMQQERLDRIAKSLMMKGPLALLGLTIGFYLTGSVFWGVVGLAMARVAVMVGYDMRNATLSLRPSSNLARRLIPKDLPRPRWDASTLLKLAGLGLPLGFVTMLDLVQHQHTPVFRRGPPGCVSVGHLCCCSRFPEGRPHCCPGAGTFGQSTVGQVLCRQQGRSVSQTDAQTGCRRCPVGRSGNTGCCCGRTPDSDAVLWGRVRPAWIAGATHARRRS